jgi:hypothetical protein
MIYTTRYNYTQPITIAYYPLMIMKKAKANHTSNCHGDMFVYPESKTILKVNRITIANTSSMLATIVK